MDRLIDLIRKNTSLRYTDSHTGTEFKIADILDENCFDTLSRKRSLAFLYLDNSISSVTALLNFFNSEHVVALLNPALNNSLKENLEQFYCPAYIFDSSRIEIEGFQRYDWLQGNKLFFQPENSTVLHPELKLLLSTSGTTGSPKFVKLSENNIVSNAQAILEYLPIVSEDVVPLNLPLYYSYGLSVFTTNSISGGKLICTDKDILQKEFWQEMERYGYSSLAGVPYFYEMLNRLGFTKKEYPSLRYMTQAGGKLNDKIINVFADYCKNNAISFFIMYGQTEATARMSYLPPSFLETKQGSVGKPIANGTFTIDSDTAELIYEGPNVFGGYAENVSDLTVFNSIRKLHTGDTARADEDGFYYITGRLKRFAKLYGNRINLDEVEQLLKNNFNMIQFACVAVNDQYLLIAQAGADSVADDQIKYYIFDALKIHPSSVKIQHLKEIPLTANGKPDYPKILVIHTGTD